MNLMAPAIQIMNKNTIIFERNQLRTQIKQLVAQYDELRNKDQALGLFQQEQMFQVMNSIAMRYAKDGFTEQAQTWLQKALPLTTANPRLAVILHNNAACVYKNQHQYDKALEHLKKSEGFLKQIRSKPGYNKRYDRLLLDCWLNLSALYSSKKMHEEAFFVIESAEKLINHNLEQGMQKFIEQLVIARYNKIVELEHLGKVEQAYYCCDDTKRIMYDRRVYKHFLEQKLNDVHKDLRKKLFGQNQHKRAVSLAASICKLRQSVNMSPANQENLHRRIFSNQKCANKLAMSESSKENCDALTSRPTTQANFSKKNPIKRKTVMCHPISRLSISPMVDILNRCIPRR